MLRVTFRNPLQDATEAQCVRLVRRGALNVNNEGTLLACRRFDYSDSHASTRGILRGTVPPPATVRRSEHATACIVRRALVIANSFCRGQRPRASKRFLIRSAPEIQLGIAAWILRF